MAKKHTKHDKRPSTQKRRVKRPRNARLRQSELLIRRFVVNQPTSRMGIQPGRFRNTLTGEEHEQFRANILLWRRGRVYFGDSDATLPACKSNDGLTPSPVVDEPKSESCGHVDDEGRFVPQCPLAAWRYRDGRRCAPPCRETWNFLGILQQDDLPFWMSLKGSSLRSARRLLSMCYEITRQGKHDLLDCCITISVRLVQGRSFQYYVVQFSDPQWLAKSSKRHRQLKRKLRKFSPATIQATFDAEQADVEPYALAG